MATDIEQELSEVFDLVGSSMPPLPPELADQVRRGVRTYRRRMGAVVVAAALVVAGVTVVVVNNGLGGKPAQKISAGPQQRFRQSDSNVVAMTATTSTLYVATNAYPKGLVTAYDRATGGEVGAANLPAGPSSVAVAPDGTVWVTFYPSNAGHRPGVAEFSADLTKRSMLLTNDHYLPAAPFDVLPFGRGRAVLATDQGTVTVTLAQPGGSQPVQATRHNATVMAPSAKNYLPTRVAVVGGSVATLGTTDGGRSRLIINAGESGSADSLAAVQGTEMTIASSQEGLWATTGTGATATLELFDATLHPLPTGAVINTASLPGGADRVWTSGRTVWVATERQRVKLTCFDYASPTSGPSATITLPIADSVQRTDPIATGDITIAPTEQQVYVASPYGITNYPVPAACQ
ncbi:MAG TPA: hypothetical protein VHV79_06630 [Mycobacteriales bacterium]|jgi:hypothetical protein|nr:hypothetical protein [Mycobacteriales bacterium]